MQVAAGGTKAGPHPGHPFVPTHTSGSFLFSSSGRCCCEQAPARGRVQRPEELPDGLPEWSRPPPFLQISDDSYSGRHEEPAPCGAGSTGLD